jgi:hypothetical protein
MTKKIGFRVWGVGFREREMCVEKDLAGATIDFIIRQRK